MKRPCSSVLASEKTILCTQPHAYLCPYYRFQILFFPRTFKNRGELPQQIFESGNILKRIKNYRKLDFDFVCYGIGYMSHFFHLSIVTDFVVFRLLVIPHTPTPAWAFDGLPYLLNKKIININISYKYQK